jgi:hypothetical protein
MKCINYIVIIILLICNNICFADSEDIYNEVNNNNLQSIYNISISVHEMLESIKDQERQETQWWDNEGVIDFQNFMSSHYISVKTMINCGEFIKIHGIIKLQFKNIDFYPINDCFDCYPKYKNIDEDNKPHNLSELFNNLNAIACRFKMMSDRLKFLKKHQQLY